MVEEVWKDIEGFEGAYQVSSYGNVKSLERYVPMQDRMYHKKEKMLKQNTLKQGYKAVALCKDSKIYPFTVHRLVAIAFIPNPDKKPIVDHIDTDAGNNNVENLRWVTQEENCNNPLSRQHVSQAKMGHPYWGKPHSEETRKKLSEAKRGRVLTDEHKEKLRQAHLGKKQTPEHIKHATDAKRGRVLSDETKNKLSESHKGLLKGKHWKMEGGKRVWY